MHTYLNKSKITDTVRSKPFSFIILNYHFFFDRRNLINTYLVTIIFCIKLYLSLIQIKNVYDKT